MAVKLFLKVIINFLFIHLCTLGNLLSFDNVLKHLITNITNIFTKTYLLQNVDDV